MSGERAPPPLGPTIRAHRERAGLSLRELADRCGCVKSYLWAIEHGRRGPPSEEILRKIERALAITDGQLVRLGAWAHVPAPVREDLSRARSQAEVIRRLGEILTADGFDDQGRPRGSLDEAHRSGELQRLIGRLDPELAGGGAGGGGGAAPIDLPFEVPLINKVAAGYPQGFTDMGYPARVADEYVRCPDLHDPDAFAARVVGDSMAPDYREGDIVIFSPSHPIADGDDCFARLALDDETTFKRVYFEPGGEVRDQAGRIRLQPINSRYAPRVLDREEVAGLYRAVKVLRSV
ncbi:MAG: helix-turn-helix domain-containing protein [Phycisphaeraceae bacterium]|nr:MAG: helix-turn-helix domain-containing protein [Phycisphaeraceae bacterium]